MHGLDRILLENIRITAQVITEICQRSTRKEVSEQPLSRNQFYILKILATSGEHLMSELAQILDISPAATSKNIGRMEQMGLVERQVRPGDRRHLEVRLLDEGRRIVAEFERVTIRKQTALMEQFTETEKTQLLGYLQRIVKFTLSGEYNTDLICLQCGGQCGEACVVKTGAGICSKDQKA